MNGSLMAAFVTLWLLVAVPTMFARFEELRGEEVGAVAAGVLWPIYLPYRLALILWTGKP
jgi:hypothetical protein